MDLLQTDMWLYPMIKKAIGNDFVEVGYSEYFEKSGF
jgi:hypothetical protein